MKEKLLSLKSEVREELKNAKSVHELNAVKARYVGKKSPLQEVLGKMREADAETRKTLGKAINEFKSFVEEEVSARLQEITAAEIQSGLKASAWTSRFREKDFRPGACIRFLKPSKK